MTSKINFLISSEQNNPIYENNVYSAFSAEYLVLNPTERKIVYCGAIPDINQNQIIFIKPDKQLFINNGILGIDSVYTYNDRVNNKELSIVLWNTLNFSYENPAFQGMFGHKNKFIISPGMKICEFVVLQN